MRVPFKIFCSKVCSFFHFLVSWTLYNSWCQVSYYNEQDNEFPKYKTNVTYLKQPSCKKVAVMFKKACAKKVVKSKGVGKKWLWWYRLMAKILITFRWILCWFLGWGNTNCPELLLLKFCHQPIPSQPFLGHPLWFHNFFSHWPLWTGPHLFYS